MFYFFWLLTFLAFFAVNLVAVNVILFDAPDKGQWKVNEGRGWAIIFTIILVMCPVGLLIISLVLFLWLSDGVLSGGQRFDCGLLATILLGCFMRAISGATKNKYINICLLLMSEVLFFALLGYIFVHQMPEKEVIIIKLVSGSIIFLIATSAYRINVRKYKMRFRNSRLPTNTENVEEIK